jgi:hypothetical protein
MDFILPKTSQSDIYDLQTAFENDLIAFYKILEDKVMKLLESDKSIEEITLEIQNLLT